MTIVKTQEFIEHLKAKWKGRACPLCNTGNWNVSDRTFELREYHGGNLVIGDGPILPLVAVTCDNCGNTVLVNAIVSKAIEKAGGS